MNDQIIVHVRGNSCGKAFTAISHKDAYSLGLSMMDGINYSRFFITVTIGHNSVLEQPVSYRTDYNIQGQQICC